MRLDKLKSELDKLGLKAFVFTNRNNIYYFSGIPAKACLRLTETDAIS